MENTFFYNHYTWCRLLDKYLESIRYDYFHSTSYGREQINFYKLRMDDEKRKPLNPYER
jgi:hypothetical protein